MKTLFRELVNLVTVIVTFVVTVGLGILTLAAALSPEFERPVVLMYGFATLLAFLFLMLELATWHQDRLWRRGVRQIQRRRP